MSFGLRLHEHLRDLDRKGNSYSLCLNGSNSDGMVDVAEHSPSHLKVYRADGKGGVYFVNANNLLTVEIIEHG